MSHIIHTLNDKKKSTKKYILGTETISLWFHFCLWNIILVLFLSLSLIKADGWMKIKTFLEFQDRNRTLKILRTKREIRIYYWNKIKKYIFFLRTNKKHILTQK